LYRAAPKEALKELSWVFKNRQLSYKILCTNYPVICTQLC